MEYPPSTRMDTEQPPRQQQGWIFIPSNILCNEGGRQGTNLMMQLAALETN